MAESTEVVVWRFTQVIDVSLQISKAGVYTTVSDRLLKAGVYTTVSDRLLKAGVYTTVSDRLLKAGHTKHSLCEFCDA